MLRVPKFISNTRRQNVVGLIMIRVKELNHVNVMFIHSYGIYISAERLDLVGRLGIWRLEKLF